ncbi:MAG: rhomboid family intramembrane serine protease [Thermodesulfobacteriota bacterium]|nr:rhomboid family intramembrane serine protease [Thermodesulfobacteriota bacterium]
MIPIKDDNPTKTFPFIIIFLIFTNCLIFFYQIVKDDYVEYFIVNFGVIPYQFTHFRYIHSFHMIPFPLTLFTYMFLHGGFFHLLSNMLFLWIFGCNIEDVLGHFKFLFFYTLCGFVAGLFHIFNELNSMVPMIGASGAIAGILGAYFILFPKAKIHTLIIIFFIIKIIRIPAVVFIGIWFLIQILSSGTGDKVAWYAHIGGFISGIIFIICFMPKRSIRR